MPIAVVCEGCGKRYAAKDEWAGKSLRCKGCGAVVQIPQPVVDLASLDLSDLGVDPAAAPPQPVSRSNRAARRKAPLKLAALGAWTIPCVAAALMLVLLIPALLSKTFAGLVMLIGIVASGGYLLCGLGLLLFKIFQIAGQEGAGAVFHVLLWTRTGRRFVYAQWREYRKAGLFLLQGVLLFAWTVGALMLIMAVNPLDKKDAPAVAAEEKPPELTEEDMKRIEEQSRAIQDEAQRAQEEMDARFKQQREAREARHAQARQRAQQSTDERKQALIDKYGSDTVVTVIVEGAPLQSHAAIVGRIRELAGTTALQSRGSGDHLWVATAPVVDVAALAAKIDFGEVRSVDREQRTITVVADPGWQKGSD